MSQNPSLFIQNVLPQFNENDIKKAIDCYNWGIIQNIRFKTDRNRIRNAIVDFAEWNLDNTYSIRSLLYKKDFAKVYYKPDRFWKAFEYIMPKSQYQPQRMTSTIPSNIQVKSILRPTAHEFIPMTPAPLVVDKPVHIHVLPAVVVLTDSDSELSQEMCDEELSLSDVSASMTSASYDTDTNKYYDMPVNPVLDYGDNIKFPPPIFVRKNGNLVYTKIKKM